MRSEPDSLAEEPRLFHALLTPHRSLSQTGFLILMAAFGFVSFVAGVAFWLIGAWPVFGFFGLDVLLLYGAFRISFARARAFEEIVVTPSELRLRRVDHRGHAMEWTLNPLWVRLERTEHAEFGIEQLDLIARGRRIAVASFLNPDDKASFARALSAALAAARRGFDHAPGARRTEIGWKRARSGRRSTP